MCSLTYKLLTYFRWGNFKMSFWCQNFFQKTNEFFFRFSALAFENRSNQKDSVRESRWNTPISDAPVKGSDKTKRMNKFGLFAVKNKKANKANSFLHFLGESTASHTAIGFIWPFSKHYFLLIRLFYRKSGTKYNLF